VLRTMAVLLRHGWPSEVGCTSREAHREQNKFDKQHKITNR
jgi:hypothetical protein